MSVYFVRNTVTGSFKIGTTDRNPRERMRALQTASDATLELVLDIPFAGPLFESELHRRFATARIRGEWFSPSSEILAFVADWSSLDRIRMGFAVFKVELKAKTVESLNRFDAFLQEVEAYTREQSAKRDAEYEADRLLREQWAEEDRQRMHADPGFHERAGEVRAWIEEMKRRLGGSNGPPG